MKNLLTIITAFCILAVSCKKDHQTVNVKPTTAEKKYLVKFSVAQFTQTVGSITDSRMLTTAQKRNLAVTPDTTSLKNSVVSYYYVVYDASGKEINRIHRLQGLTDSFYDYKNGVNDGNGVIEPTTNPFNVITDSLASGTYTIVIVGTGKQSAGDIVLNLALGYDDVDSAPTVFSPLQSAVLYDDEGLDQIPRSNEIFFSKSTITVGNQNLNNDITISRIVGQLQVVLQDAIPGNVRYINVTRYPEYYSFSIADTIPKDLIEPLDEFPYSDSPMTLTSADKGKPNYTTQRFMLNTISPFTVIITAFDANEQIIGQKTVNNVRLYKNRRTTLTGKLFDNTSQAQFAIHANQAWGPPGPTINF
jgi:hypothetical protein